MARLTPKSFRIVTGAALGSLCVIVVTGALVRLTGSGLGCEDWPRCNESRFVDVSSGHTFIEQGNRLFTGFVSLTVICAVLLAHRLRPVRRDLVWLAWSLVFGVLAQIVIGGVVVLTGLNPYANMAHFLVSILLIACALLLYRRSAVSQSDPWWRPIESRVFPHNLVLAFFGLVAIVTGTVVTATGPHAGDETAVRFGFELESVARVHGISVVITIGLLLSLVWRMRSSQNHGHKESMNSLVFVTLAQGAIGYTQYFTGVPIALVTVHIVGALSFFIALMNTLIVPMPKDEVLSRREAIVQ